MAWSRSLAAFLAVCGLSAAVVCEREVPVEGTSCDRLTWTDASGAQRWVAIARGRDAEGYLGGYIRALSYDGGGGTPRTCRGTRGDLGGFGLVVMHGAAIDYPAAVSKKHGRDLRAEPMFVGRHHATYAVTMTIPTRVKDKQGQVRDAGPVGVTIHYSVRSGRSDFLYAIAFDSGLTEGLCADTRTPYGDFEWEGNGRYDEPISGFGWAAGGKRFRTTSTPLAATSSWDWSADCAVPHIIEWKDAGSGDAEIGLVQTQTSAQHDAGAGWWLQMGKSGQGLPEKWNLTYQLNTYQDYAAKKVTWMMQYGAVGAPAFDVFGGGRKAAGRPLQAYSLFCIFDRHSSAAVDGVVSEMNTLHAGATLTASTGSVVLRGPAGPGQTMEADYQPAGWDHVQAQWTVRCAGGAAACRLEAPAGGLANPTFCFTDYAAGGAPLVVLDGKDLVPDRDCFISLDAQGRRCLVTLARPVPAGGCSLAIRAP